MVVVAALVAVSSGCREAESVVYVSVEAKDVMANVSSLRVSVSMAAGHDVRVFPAKGTKVDFPVSLVLVLPRSRSGRLDIVVEGIGGANNVVCAGSGQTTIVVGGEAKASVLLSAGPSLCGNGSVDSGEQCDDANLFSFDGCDFRCASETATGKDGGVADSRAELRDATNAYVDAALLRDATAVDGDARLWPTDAITVDDVSAVDVATAYDVAPDSAGARDAGAPDAAAPVDAAPDVPAGSVTCSGHLVDLDSDPSHCGACDYACAGGRSCQSGRCTPAWVKASTVGQPSRRFRHGAAMSNSRVLISGGALTSNSGSLGDTFFYNPTPDSWSPGPPLNQSRCGHTSVGINGKVHVFGGLSDCASGGSVGPAMEEYAPGTNSWQVVAASSEPVLRYNGSALVTTAGDLLVFGGSGGAFSNTASAAKYVSSSQSWADVSCDLPGCATSCAGLFSWDATSVVAWGGSVPIAGAQLNLTTGSWAPWTRPAGGPSLPTQYAEDDGHWYVLTGNTSDECPTTVTAWVFDKKKGAWTSDPSASPSGIAISTSNSNQTVWTGQELFVWSGRCDPQGVGWRYQPRAPTVP